MKHKSLTEAMKAAKLTGKRQQVEAQKGPNEVKVNISIRLDLEVLNWFKAEAERTGISYQTLINSALFQRARLGSFEDRLAKLENKQKVG